MTERGFVVLYTSQKTKKAKTWHDGTLKFSGNGTKGVLYDDKNCRIDTIHMRPEDVVMGEQLESDRHFILIEEESKVGATNQNEALKNRPVIGPTKTERFKPQIRTGLKKRHTGFIPPRMIAVKDLEPVEQQTTGMNNVGKGIQSLGDNSHHVALFHQKYNIMNKSSLPEPSDPDLFVRDPLFSHSMTQNSPDGPNCSKKSSPLIGQTNNRPMATSPWSTFGSSQSPARCQLDAPMLDSQELGTKSLTYINNERSVGNTSGLQNANFDELTVNKRSAAQIVALLSRTSGHSHSTSSCSTTLQKTKLSPQSRLSNERKDTGNKFCGEMGYQNQSVLQSVEGGEEQSLQQSGKSAHQIFSYRTYSDQSMLSNSSQRCQDNSDSFVAGSKNQPGDSHYDLITTPALETYVELGRTKSSCVDPGNRSERRVMTDPQNIIRTEVQGHVTSFGSIVKEMESTTSVYEVSDPSEVSNGKPVHSGDDLPKGQSAEESSNVRTLVNGDLVEDEEEDEMPCDGGASFAISFSPLSVIPSDSDSDCEDPQCSGENKSSNQEYTNSQSSVIDFINGSSKTKKACTRREGLVEEACNKREGLVEGMCNKTEGLVEGACNKREGLVEGMCKKTEGFVEGTCNKREGLVEAGEVTSGSDLQTGSHCIKEIGDELNTLTCVSVNMDSECPPFTEENTYTDLKQENEENIYTDLKQEKKSVSKQTGGVRLDSSGTPFTSVNRDEKGGEPVKEVEIEGLCVSQKRSGYHTDTEGYSQKSLGCLEFTPDSPRNFMNCSQISSYEFSHHAQLNVISSADTRACHENDKLPVFETSWSDDGSVFDMSPVRLNKHQLPESNSDHPDLSLVKYSQKCLAKFDSQNTERQNCEHSEYNRSSVSKTAREGHQDLHGDRNLLWSGCESDQRWTDREAAMFDESSSETSVSSSSHCVTNTEHRDRRLPNRNQDISANRLPNRVTSLQSPPQSVNLVRSPAETKHRDLSQKIYERMGFYKMRGSVTGMVAKRQGNLTSHQSGRKSDYAPNIVHCQVTRRPRKESLRTGAPAEGTPVGDWIDRLQVEHKNTRKLSSLGSAMNTSKACHAKPKMGNNCNIDRVTSPILENCITSHNSHDTLLETEEQILNNISLNESCATSESVTTICLQDEELCKDSVYRRPRKMCFLSPDAAMSPISQVSPISPVRLHGEISPRSQQFEDQGHNSSHVHRNPELVYDVSSRLRQKVADFSGRGIEGRYEGLNDAVEGRYEGLNDAVEGCYEGNDAESVVSNWTKYLPVEDEEDINDLNCSYDLDTSIRKINRESQRYTSSVMTFHKTGIYDQVSDSNGFRSNTGNTSQHEVHAETWGLGSSTSDIRIKQTPQHAARDLRTSTSDIRGKQTPQHAAGGPGTSILDIRGKQTPQHAAGGPGTSTLDIRGKQTTQHAAGGPATSTSDIRGKQTPQHAAGGPGTSILDIRGKQTTQHEVYNAAGGPGTSTLNIREKQTFGFKNNLHSNNSELLENDEGSDQRTLSKKNMDSFHRGKITKTYMEDCSSLDVTQKPNYTSHQQNERKSANQCMELTKSTNECIDLTKSTNQYIDLTKSTNQCVGLSPDLDAVCASSSPSLYNSPDFRSQRLNSPVSRSFPSESQCDQISDSVNQTVPQCVNSHNNTRVSSPSSQRVPETQMNIPIGSVVLISSKERFNPPEMNPASSPNILIGTKRSLWDDLQFASLAEVENNPTPVRRIVIPTVFSSPLQYKQVLTATLKEHLNIILFVLAKQYHQAMSKTDTSNLTFPVKNTLSNQNKKTTGAPLPPCLCGVSSKLVQVRKDGPNKGRFFYSCTNPANQRCRFFQWADSAGNVSQHHMGGAKIKLTDAGTVTSYFRQQHIMLYCHCQFLQKSMENILAHFKNPWAKQKYQRENKMQRKFFIRLSRKDPSTLFSKDDLWIISRDLSFDLTCTFLARSSYYGPTSGNEVEIEPLSKFSPSNWNNEDPCHAILAGNVSSELSYLDNLEENLQQSGVPILSQLLHVEDDSACKTNKGFQPPRMKRGQAACNIHVPVYAMNELVMEFMKTYSLNVDQGTALGRLAAMFCEDSHSDMSSILLIHGVFGAGKSFLLSVMIRFLVRVFEVNGSYTPGLPYPWKILISSTTNVAVDRVLMGLLDIGFEDFVRVGSMKKIAKPVLPYSVHATGTETHELKDLQEMLRSGDLSASEKHNVRQSIEKHKLGENKKKLSSVSVVGVTCASCVAPCLKDLKFPVMIVDECSQMTEPASLFPVSKFACQKLVLVGDPKQLDPTIQGSEANHTQGLEQTMFDRLIKMGHIPTMLRTQYRCHPIISNLANTLFYQGQLSDGIEPTDREPLLETLPPLCFYDVSNGQENCDSGGSFSNEKEADFVVFMIEALVNAGVDSTSIGVITLYKSQMYNIMAKLGTSRNCQKETKSILVSTVDAFQGGERDVIILSCVRTNHTGFIDNHKRTNVALTRARNHLFIVGHLQNLEKNLLWGKVITMCKACCDGVQNAEEARHNLGFLQSEESSQHSSSNPKSASSGQNRKRKQEEMESPPMSLSGHTDELVCESPVTISSSEMLDEVPQKQVKRRRGLPQIDVTLLDSDKENEDEDSDEDELPVFNV